MRRCFRHLTLALILVPLGMPGVLAASSSSTSSTTAVTVSDVQIDNFGRVNAGYYRGAQPQGRDYPTLAAIGVKTVIDLTSDDTDPAEPGLVQQTGMRYVHLPMTVHAPPTAAQLATFLGIVNDPQNQPVYVHCVGGRHRTGVMTAAYRMSFEGWTADKAFREMKQYKFGADFLHSEFKAFVYGFHPTAQREN